MGLLRRIKRFIAGDTERTAFSASVMNELVDVCNAVLSARGQKGIQVHIADGGLVFELTDSLQDSLGMLTIQNPDGATDEPPGILRWRGKWDATKQYRENDLVIVTADNVTTAPYLIGTFRAKEDVPVGLAPADPETADIALDAFFSWEVFSKSSWDNLLLRSEEFPNLEIQLAAPGVDGAWGIPFIRIKNATTGYDTYISSDRVLIGNPAGGVNNIFEVGPVVGGGGILRVWGSPTTFVEIAPTTIPSDAIFQLVTFKNSAGVDESRWILCTNPV